MILNFRLKEGFRTTCSRRHLHICRCKGAFMGLYYVTFFHSSSRNCFRSTNARKSEVAKSVLLVGCVHVTRSCNSMVEKQSLLTFGLNPAVAGCGTPFLEIFWKHFLEHMRYSKGSCVSLQTGPGGHEYVPLSGEYGFDTPLPCCGCGIGWFL